MWVTPFCPTLVNTFYIIIAMEYQHSCRWSPWRSSSYSLDIHNNNGKSFKHAHAITKRICTDHNNTKCGWHFGLVTDNLNRLWVDLFKFYASKTATDKKNRPGWKHALDYKMCCNKFIIRVHIRSKYRNKLIQFSEEFHYNLFCLRFICVMRDNSNPMG